MSTLQFNFPFYPLADIWTLFCLRLLSTSPPQKKTTTKHPHMNILIQLSSAYMYAYLIITYLEMEFLGHQDHIVSLGG